MSKVEYDSNNSGGNWWLTDDDWKALEQAGWVVAWIKDNDSYTGDSFLGALATSATREGLSKADAIAEWESITGENADDCGCACCGQPHYFSVD